MITSNLPISGRFANTIDFYDLVPNRDIAFSTAVHNSARFPFLDAAGSVMQDAHVSDRLVDGGYFENFGAATALDVLEQLIDGGVVWPDSNPSAAAPRGRWVDPIVIQLSNDASVPPKRPLCAPVPVPDVPLPSSFRVVSDMTTPLIAFYDTRDGLGQRATDVLRNRLAYLSKDGANDSHYFHFQIGDPRVPMSWLLSDYAGQLIDAQLPRDASSVACKLEEPSTRPACNKQELDRLLTLFPVPHK